MNCKVYKDGTTLYQIVEDGWARGLDPEQTLIESNYQGYLIDIESIKSFFALFQYRMELDMSIERRISNGDNTKEVLS